MVTDTGLRVPIDLRLVGVNSETGIRYWEPMIEGDLDAIMPSVIGFDGPRVNKGEAITFSEPGPGWNTKTWGNRVMENSRHIFSHYDPDDVQIDKG